MVAKGDVVLVHTRVGVVVVTGEELGEGLDDHTGVWFGTFENDRPVVWTIPTEYLVKGPQPLLKH